MLDKLTEVRHHYEEIGHQLSDPTVISDNVLYRNLMREYKKLTPVVEKYNEYKRAEAAFEEAKALLEEGGLEPDFRAMVQAEYDENKQRCEQAAEELRILMLPRPCRPGGRPGHSSNRWARPRYRPFAAAQRPA